MHAVSDAPGPRGVLDLDVSEVTGHPRTGSQRRRGPLQRTSTLSVVLPWYLLSRVIVLVGMAFASELTGRSIAHILRAWDGRIYLALATHGYVAHLHFHPSEIGKVNQWNIAFLPGFPLVIAGLHHLGIPSLAAGVTIAEVGGFVTTLLVARLGSICFNDAIGLRAARLFCMLPGALVFSWVYSEGLALALGLGAVVLLLRRRWLAAGALGALAGAVRVDLAVSVGAAALVASIIVVWRERCWRSLVAPALVPIGFLGYLAYLQIFTGSWENWFRTERYGWDQHLDLGQHTLTLLGSYLADPFSKEGFAWVASFVFALCVLVALGYRRTPAVCAVMAITALALAVASGNVGLRPRALLLLAPGLPALAAFIGERATRALVTTFAALTPLLVIAYTTKPTFVP